MSRVRAVVGRSIMVHFDDIVMGDVLYIRGKEDDPIIKEVERNGDLVRFHYIPTTRSPVTETMWMDPELGCHVFINDLKNERAGFVEEEVA